MTDFTQLGLSKPLLRALADKGYTTPTPIQTLAIPTVLAGRDLLGIAQTGTGKTAAFALPILHRLAADPRPAPRRGCRVLVLTPTRELATQIADSFKAYGRHLGLTTTVVFGGVKYGAQVRALAAGVDILVATPGRLIDHMEQKFANLGSVEMFVLDEADQMLDLGFLPPIRRIVATLPKVRQNLFFSATMPGEIGKLAAELLVDPARASVTPSATTVSKIDQSVLFVETDRKRQLLAELFTDKAMGRALIFTRTKRGADRVGKYLEGAGIRADSIHGDKSQGQRERALAAFKSGAVRALVATDIAARGIDVDSVTHVVNYDLPNVPEAYVHRIGRTARAGAGGIAISLVSDDE
ncbi:MAG TPA: DEAD/DEAH box helicase, partial [Caulobacteraceae bacterium]